MFAAASMRRGAAIALMTLLAAGCSLTEEPFAFDSLAFQERTGIVFITQNVVPDAVMEALFEGRVVADAAGCLRLDSPDPATVVWPKGFTMTANGSTMVVRDAEGSEVGQIGGSFSLGGGEVQSLHGGIGVSAADRERAETHCPGRYWIVGELGD